MVIGHVRQAQTIPVVPDAQSRETYVERPQHNLLFGFPLVMCFQKLPVFTLLGVFSVGFQALFFDFGRTYPVGSGSGRP
jgi:hypothetical protein